MTPSPADTPTLSPPPAAADALAGFGVLLIMATVALAPMLLAVATRVGATG
jgi:hypothetical protein